MSQLLRSAARCTCDTQRDLLLQSCLSMRFLLDGKELTQACRLALGLNVSADSLSARFLFSQWHLLGARYVAMGHKMIMADNALRRIGYKSRTQCYLA